MFGRALVVNDLNMRRNGCQFYESTRNPQALKVGLELVNTFSLRFYEADNEIRSRNRCFGLKPKNGVVNSKIANLAGRGCIKTMTCVVAGDSAVSRPSTARLPNLARSWAKHPSTGCIASKTKSGPGDEADVESAPKSLKRS